MDRRTERIRRDEIKAISTAALTRDIGIVTDTDPLTVRIGLDAEDTALEYAGIHKLEDCFPQVDDLVWVSRSGRDYFVHGVIGPGGDLGSWHALPLLSQASTAPVSNLVYFARLLIPRACILTGFSWLHLSVGSGVNARVALYDEDGARVANKTSGQAMSALSWPKVPFDSPYVARPGVYHAGVVFSAAQGTFMAGTPLGPSGSVAGPGSGATATSITPPTVMGTAVPALSTY